jgi:hypothetical protein
MKNQPRLAGPHNVMNAYVGPNGKAGQQGTLHSITLHRLPLPSELIEKILTLNLKKK